MVKKEEKDKEVEKVLKKLDGVNKEIDDNSKQQVVLKHEYRSTRDKTIKEEIMKKWDKIEKKIIKLEKRRRKIVEEKNEIEFKRKWKGWKKN